MGWLCNFRFQALLVVELLLMPLIVLWLQRLVQRLVLRLAMPDDGLLLVPLLSASHYTNLTANCCLRQSVQTARSQSQHVK